jgi:hypothetical protein
MRMRRVPSLLTFVTLQGVGRIMYSTPQLMESLFGEVYAPMTWI